MEKQKISINIAGMHCKSCEMLLEESISKVRGVTEVQANHKKGVVDIYYHNQQPDSKVIQTAVNDAGYKTADQSESTGLFSKDQSIYRNLFYIVVVIFIGYLLLNKIGWFSFDWFSGGNLTYPIILLVGLTAGFSSCMALVGGLILAVASRFAQQNEQASTWSKFKPHLFFNFGRILGFFILGGILGALGSLFQLSVGLISFITIIVGVVMLILGLQLTKIFPHFSSWQITLPKFLSQSFYTNHKNKSKYSHLSSMISGSLTFFLPCGFTQAMQLYAVSSGSFWRGALVMSIFAIGTAPGLLSVGGLSSLWRGRTAQKFYQFVGVILILLAIFNIRNGFNLSTTSSINNNEVGKQNQNFTNSQDEQVVNMESSYSGYQPRRFVIQKGVPVKWVINVKDPYTCASDLVFPYLNLRKRLQAGENIIQFTPNQIGRLKFSCSMGMYTGYFEVVDKLDTSQSPNNILSNNGDDQEQTATTCTHHSLTGRGCGGCGFRTN